MPGVSGYKPGWHGAAHRASMLKGRGKVGRNETSCIIYARPAVAPMGHVLERCVVSSGTPLDVVSSSEGKRILFIFKSA